MRQAKPRYISFVNIVLIGIIILLLIPWIRNHCLVKKETPAATTATTPSSVSYPFLSFEKPEPESVTVEQPSKTLKSSSTLRPIKQPVLGELATKGAQPLYGVKHQGGDAIFALSCNYQPVYYQRFVGSLRKSGFSGDIVLAVSPPEKMFLGVDSYLKKHNVVAYAFDVDCVGVDNCKFKDDFLGYPDPRPHRTFANLRYGLYEYWMQHYRNPNAYILILDSKDTFFQLNPFLSFGPIEKRTPKFELQVFAENVKVGDCLSLCDWIFTFCPFSGEVNWHLHLQF